MAFEEYPKVIRVGDTTITVKSAEEEATWRASQAPPKAAPKAPEPAAVTAPKPKEPEVVAPRPPFEKHPEPKAPTHKGGKK